MPNIKETERPARKLLPIIYVLDSSGSMEGNKIACVNRAMKETMEVMKSVSNENPTAELKVGAIEFSTGAEEITKDGLVYLEDFYWTDLTAGGLTDYGSALKMLHEDMSREGWIKSDIGYKPPVMIFMSDGRPTDDYKAALENLKVSNKWFQIASKIGIAIGGDADRSVLAEITGNPEAVIKVDDLTTLKKLIRTASVTAAMIGSKSRTTNDITGEIIDSIKQEMGNTVTTDTGDGDGSGATTTAAGAGVGTSTGTSTGAVSGSTSGGQTTDEDPWGDGWD